MVFLFKDVGNYHLNGILADEMGLGKHSSPLGYFITTAGKVSLVICPKTYFTLGF
jgi:hypothetical protein